MKYIESQYTGVHWDTTKKKWVAQKGIDYKKFFLGYFDTEKEAYEARVKFDEETKGNKADRKIVMGDIFGKYEVIGDTGKRNESKNKIYLVRHIETNEVKETLLISLKRGDSTGYRSSSENKEFVKNVINPLAMKYMTEKDLKEGTRLSALKDYLPSDNTSGFRGVNYRKDTKKWRAYINFKGKNISLGSFNNKQDAINARLDAEEKYFKPILEKYKK